MATTKTRSEPDKDWKPEGWDADNSSYDSKNPSSKAGTPPPPRKHDRIKQPKTPPPPRAEDKIDHPETPPPPTADDWRSDDPPPPGVAKQDPYSSEADKEHNPADKKSDKGKDATEKESEANKEDGQKTAETDKEKALRNPVTEAKEEGKKKQEERSNKKRRGLFKSSRKKIILTVGAIGIAVSIFGAIAFLPSFALKTLTSRLQDAFMDRVGHAMQVRAEHYITKYLRGRGSPILPACNNVITSDCYSPRSGQGRVSRLISSWNKAKADERLFSRFGVTIETDTRTGEIRYFRNGVLQEKYGRRDAANNIYKDLMDVAEARGVRDRWLLKHTINSKYGGKWCLFLCKQKDALFGKSGSTLRKLKLKIAARVIAKANARLGAYMICAIGNCTRDQLDDDTRRAAKEALGTVDEDFLADLDTRLDNRTITKFVADKIADRILSKIGFGGASKAGFSQVPVIGWIYVAIEISVLLDSIDQSIENKALSNFIAERNIAAYVDYGTNFSTLADEVQSFDSSLEEKGAAFQLIVGFASSRTWQAINKHRKSTVTCRDVNGVVEAVLEGEEPPHTCPSKQVRPEIAFEQVYDNQLLSTILDFQRTYDDCIFDIGFGSIPIIGEFLGGGIGGIIDGIFGDGTCRPTVRTIARGIVGTVEWILGQVAEEAIALLKRIPVLGSVIGAIESAGTAAGEALVEALVALMDSYFPLVVNALAEGSELLDQIAGYFNATAYTFAQGVEDPDTGETIGLGLKAVNNEEAASIDRAIAERKRIELEGQSIFTRYFDVNNHSSLLSSTLMGVASSAPSGSPLGFGIDPFSVLGNVGSLFGLMPRASAQEAAISGLPTDRSELFGITDYAATDEDLDIDSAELDEERCAEIAMEREETATIDEETGEKVYNMIDICQLDEMVILMLTKAFDLDSQAELDAYLATPIPGGTINLPGGALGNNVVAIAVNELNNYGHLVESDPELCRRIQEEYARVGVGFAGTWNCTASRGTGPWSAIFVSWVFRTAGAGGSFPYSAAHRTYINESIRNRNNGLTSGVVVGFRREEYAPRPGDLVCNARNGSGVTYDNALSSGNYDSHCDIVISNADGEIQVIGGNVVNNIGSKTYTTNSTGHVQASKIFVVIKAP